MLTHYLSSSLCVIFVCGGVLLFPPPPFLLLDTVKQTLSSMWALNVKWKFHESVYLWNKCLTLFRNFLSTCRFNTAFIGQGDLPIWIFLVLFYTSVFSVIIFLDQQAYSGNSLFDSNLNIHLFTASSLVEIRHCLMGCFVFQCSKLFIIIFFSIIASSQCLSTFGPN